MAPVAAGNIKGTSSTGYTRHPDANSHKAPLCGSALRYPAG